VLEGPYLVGLSLAAIVVAFVFIWRGNDVRPVLFVTSLAIGALAGQTGVVFRKTAETLADDKFLLPICAAMGFAHVMRETGCVEAMVRVLTRPIERAARLLLPGGASVAFVVNMAIPSQTSTLAAVGPLLTELMARLRTNAALAGAALVFGASIGGALLNPGLAEVVAVAGMAAVAAPQLVLWVAPAVVAAFLVGLAALLLLRRPPQGTEPLTTTGLAVEGRPPAPAWKALLPPLPVVWLLLGHPSLPWHDLMRRAMPQGLEVFTAMLAGSAIAVAVAASDRIKATRSVFEGMGWAFTHIITIIAVSAGTAKALEVAGVLGAFVDLAGGNPHVALAVLFALAFGLAVVSGSGTASSVALVSAIGPRAGELGIAPLELGGVVLLAAEAGRTTSPVAAVLLFGSNLVTVPPKTLAFRLVLPCAVGAGVGAVICVWLG
jgi:DcuC family C4-dicarboxylate transporter